MSVAVSINGKHKRRSGIKELSSPGYESDIVEPLDRYDEKRTPLSRGYVPPGGWDEELLGKLVPSMGQQGPIPREEKGYTQVDLALRIAGFHTALAANCHTGNGTLPRLTDDLGCFYDLEGWWGPDNMFLPYTPEKYPVDDTAEMSEIIKETALFLGASLVGITKINRDHLYKMGWDRYGHKVVDIDERVPPSVKYAVVMAVQTDYEHVKHAPTAYASAAAGFGYSKMATLSPSVAKFIGALGYNAIACGNDTALSVPLAVDAGLGQLGRFGALITPEFGPRVRLCKVLTDLPLEPTKPIDFGVTKFCEDCERCAEYCPAQAIHYGERTPEPKTTSTNPGLRKWPLDGERCLRFWYRNGTHTDQGMFHIDCYQCVNVCPFNKAPGVLHDTVRWFVRNVPALNKLWVRLDDVFYSPMNLTGIHKMKKRKNGSKK